MNVNVPRSKLFVPADRLDSLDEALAIQPDALCLDLEDSVPAQGKAQARQLLASLLGGNPLPCATWVRVNGCGSGNLVADILSLQGAHVDVINIPKVEHPAQLDLLEELLSHIEQAANARPRSIQVVPTIETPLGLRHAAAIAAASPRVIALQIGSGDLARSTGVEPLGSARDMFRTLLVLAAAEAGIAALDSTPDNVKESDCFEADALRAKALGFRGKSCMLAPHVAVANTVFSNPS